MTRARSLLPALALALAAGAAAGPPALRAQEVKPAAATPAKADASADAKDPARIAAAKELLVAFGGLEQAKASIPQFVNALAAEIRQRDDKIAAPAEYFLRSETEPSKPRVTAYLAEVEEAATAFYARNFTVEEMKAITAFQTSPAGRKFQAETPKLVALMTPLMARFQQSLIQDMQKGLSAGAAKEPATGDKK